MKRILTALMAVLLFALPGCSATEAEQKAEPLKLDTDAKRFGYTIGQDIGSSLNQQPLELDFDAIVAGLKDAYEGKELMLTDEEIQQAAQDFQKAIMEAAQAKEKADAEKNIADGEKFLEENKAREGVITTESGLQYEVIEEGEGESPTKEDVVTVNYKGTLIDGTEFDSSYSRGEPAQFQCGGVIEGWVEALQLMKKGSKYKLYLPSELAYGDRRVSEEIGPNSVLIFEVELLDFMSMEEMQAKAEADAKKAQEAAKAEAESKAEADKK